MSNTVRVTLLVAVSLSLVGCASTLPTGRLSYATEISNPETPSIRVFMLAQDLPGCEAAISQARADFVRQKTPQRVEFGKCRMAVLEAGSDYWAVSLGRTMPGNPVILGSSVQRFCETTAQQQVGVFAKCSPTGLRFLQQ